MYSSATTIDPVPAGALSSADGVRQWLETRLGRMQRCAVRGPVSRRERSLVFYAECDRLPTPVAVKLCLQSGKIEGDREYARLQFDALRRVHGAMHGDAHYAVPRPHLLDADRGVLAVEWIDGTSMTERLASPFCGMTEAVGLMGQAGEWLRRFHDAHRTDAAALDAVERLADLSDWTAIHRDPVFVAAAEMLERTARAAGSVEMPHSWIHGDFKTDNLLLDGDRVVALDMYLRNENAVVYDIAPFLNHLELLLCRPSAWRLARRRDELFRALVDAYVHDERDGLQLPLAWTRLFLMLSTWNSARSRPRSRLRAALRERWLRAAVSRLATQLQALHR